MPARASAHQNQDPGGRDRLSRRKECERTVSHRGQAEPDPGDRADLSGGTADRRQAKAGQFIILRVDEEGERIPLTISSAEDGLVTVIYQKIGGTTLALDQLHEGDCLHDFVGPLGTAHPGGGYLAGWPCWAAAWAAPSPCRWPRRSTRPGNQVDLIGGFQHQGHRHPGGGDGTGLPPTCTSCTDDGTYGYHGFVTGKLEELI